VTQLRGRARQGNNNRGSRTLANRVRTAVDQLGGLIEENIRGNRERDQTARQERERVTAQRGPEREREYIRGGAQRQAVQRQADTSAFVRGNVLPDPVPRSSGGAPGMARGDMREATDLVAEASASDARARDSSVSEANPRAPGAELTRGAGDGRRGVLERPFTIRVDGQEIPISDSQRVVLSEYVREHPRAFGTFADWYNAISRIDNRTPDQMSVEDIAMARREWTNPEQGGSRRRRGMEPDDATYYLDPEYVRARGDVNYGGEYRYRNVDQGIDPQTGQRRIVGQRLGPVRDRNTGRIVTENTRMEMPEEPESARIPITAEERLTAESELMRIMNANQRERQRGTSRTLSRRAANDDPNTLQQPIELPRQIAEAVIARSRITQEVRALRDQENKPDKVREKAGARAGKGGDTPLMSAQEVVADQQQRQRTEGAPVDGVTLDDPEVDPFTREPILPVRPPNEGEASGSRTIRRLRDAGRARVGGVELEPTENGVRGSVRW
jgi:hypothetical protein